MRTLARWGAIVLLGIVAPLITAQPIIPELVHQTPVEGRLDNNNPRNTFAFVGSKGEAIRLTLSVASGNLDPIITVFEEGGRIVITQDDANNAREMTLSVTLDADARYRVVVGRFGYALGNTTGNYKLTFERVGVVSQQGSTLRYDVPVIDVISNTQPQVYYTFRAAAGDLLTISMERNSGTLDPYLQILDSERFLVASNDDAEGENTRNARIDNLLIEKEGVYIVVATRYGQVAGDSAGSFVLTVSTSPFSGLGNSARAPALIAYNQTVENTLNNLNYERFYRFTGKQDDIITIALDQRSGRFDAYLVLANAQLVPLIEDDDSGGGRNARIDRYRLPSDGTFTIIAMRFGGATGEGEGGFRLTLQYNGTAFANVPDDIPRLAYGTTVNDRIIAEDPESLYAFWGTQGELVTVTMTRVDGDLDPVIELLDNQRRRLIRDDDGGGGKNAAVERYALPYTGVYYIYAKRYDGSLNNPNTTGNFRLVLAQVGRQP